MLKGKLVADGRGAAGAATKMAKAIGKVVGKAEWAADERG